MGSSCYFCPETESTAIESHHIVPRRFGGSDTEENKVDVCANCHRKLEALYDTRFYKKIRECVVNEEISKAVIEGRRRILENVECFLKCHVEERSDAKAEHNGLYELYQDFCETNGVPPVSERVFIRRVRSTTEGYLRNQGVEGRSKLWQGLEIQDTEPKPMFLERSSE